jgi:pyridoxamine 5'-phosphate oxidase
VEIRNFRRNYQCDAIDVEALSADPIQQFNQWLELAHQTEVPSWFEVNAMTLCTSDDVGRVSGRIVLLKLVDELGFTFFTNYQSDKAQQLEANARAALVFYWPHLERQVRVEGAVAKTDGTTSDSYFQARPRGSQIGAIVSPQSRPLEARGQLERDVQKLIDRYGDDQPLPRPDYWGGYRLSPVRIEFWQGRPNRLHDRFLYVRSEGSHWLLTRLAP